MKQLIKNNKTGELAVKEVPAPHLGKNSILVRNRYSAVSVGTESSSVEIAKKNLIQKARSRPAEFRKVMELMKREGVLSAYRKAMSKLELPAPLGYSSAGEVVEAGKGVKGFQSGDRVACGGCGHAEIIAVPRNLCVKVPDGVSFKEAAFTTIGSIAMQGVRQAGVKLGERVVVIGLGIVGQITLQLIEAAGGNPTGIDIDKDIVDFTTNLGYRVFHRKEESLPDRIRSLTGGLGADSVIITAGTSSNDPVEFASSILRDRGRMTVVGAVRMDIPREPFYMKELSMNLSRSYGPGRYDVNYEQKGQDYPVGYVRWTENRNMAAVLELLEKGKINIEKLITDSFPFSRAPSAYDKMERAESPVIGTLLEYGVDAGTSRTINLESAGKRKIVSGEVQIGFIGAGSYAQNFLLPNLARHGEIAFRGLSTATGMNADHLGRKYGFQYVTTEAERIFDDHEVNCVFIATRHDLHARFVVAGLEAGKHVFVEKPLAICEEELERVREAYQESDGTLMVGFNRRFSPHLKKTMKFFRDNPGPKAINYRINAGFLPREHWLHDAEVGGGRIVGEACHFVDLCNFITGSQLKGMSVEVMDTGREDIPSEDTSLISLKYRDGSVAAVSYLSNGNSRLPKERIEIFGNGSSVVIEDFKKSKFYRGNRSRKFRMRKQDKGQKNEIDEYIGMVRRGGQLIPAEELFEVTDIMLRLRKMTLE